MDDWDEIEEKTVGGLRDSMRLWTEIRRGLAVAEQGADVIIRAWGEREAALEDDPSLPIHDESDSVPSLGRLRRMVRAIREAARVCPAFKLSAESEAILKRFARPGDDDGPPVLFDATELAYLDQLAKELDARSG